MQAGWQLLTCRALAVLYSRRSVLMPARRGGQGWMQAMKCPKCGGENPDNAFFCGNCGAQIGSLYHVPEAGAGMPQQPGGSYVPPATPAPGAFPPPPFPPAEPAGQPDTAPLTQEPIQPEPATYSGEPQPPQQLPPQPGAPPPSANAPGAGLLPPPPGQGYAPPADAYQVPAAGSAYPPAPGPYQVPPPGYQPPPYPGYAPTPGYAIMPPDGNTSGMGEGMPVPPETQGWTFAGCLPLGLFGLMNGVMLWGGLALAGCLIVWPLYIVYTIYIGIKGRELAWRYRRFDSVLQYEETMRVWNTWGIICLAAFVLIVIAYFVFFAALFASVFSQGFSQTP